MKIDPYIDFLKDAVVLVDRRLEQLDAEVKESPDPDSFGVYDSYDYMCGFGFVACQAYMTGVIGLHRINKRDALELGPVHRAGQRFVVLVNASANFWKHADDPGPQFESCKSTLEGLGVDCIPGQYPLTATLARILEPHPMRFENLVPFLTQWRDELPTRGT